MAAKKIQQIKGVEFGILSQRDIEKLSSANITSHYLYDTDTLKPHESGPLDPRLGTAPCEVGLQCLSCNLSPRQCVGHFGQIDLALPCFHIGFFKNVMLILRIICKSCARVLLSPALTDSWKRRMSTNILNRQHYDNLYKELIQICQKVKKCEYCGEPNGKIKKHSKILRILHEKFPKENEDKEEYDNIVDYQTLYFPNKISQFKRDVNSNTSQDLMPWDVRKLFENIRSADYVLIGIRFGQHHRPEDLILTKLVVPPTIIRPGARLQDDKSNEDDLTVQLSEILKLNNKIKIHMENGQRINDIIEEFLDLNSKISEYFKSDSVKIYGYKKIRSFDDRLKGKFGRFRGNLSGKRVNFSGRTVISPDPNLELDEIGVPFDICKILTFTEMVIKDNIERVKKWIMNGPNKHPGAVIYYESLRNGKYKDISLTKLKIRLNSINKLKYGDLVERHLMNGDVVLFNRQPSLHRVSIMSHRVKAVPFRTFRFNPCCCNPYNADFDGDEMNIHAPQTVRARAEASILLNVTKNVCAPKSGAPLVVPLQDIITSSYLLTLKRMFFDKSQVQQLLGFMDNCLQSKTSKYKLSFPAIYKPVQLWTGKQIFSMILKPTDDPKQNWPLINLETEARNYGAGIMDNKDGYVVIRNSELMSGNIDKNILGSTTKGLFFGMLRDYGSAHTARCMNRLSKLTTRFLQLYGFSAGIDDVTPTQKLKQTQNRLIQNGYNYCDDVLRHYENGTLNKLPACNSEETLETLMDKCLSQIREDAGAQCIKQLSYYYNSPLIMAECGSKGSKINISQMMLLLGQQSVEGTRIQNQFIDRTLPHFNKGSKTAKAKGFVQNSFFSGLDAIDFFFHTMGGREGLVDTACKTAISGYMQRRLIKNVEDISICYDYTVRNCKKQIMQFLFGNDGIDPMYCQSSENIIDFEAMLRHIRAQRRTQDNVSCLKPQNILNVAKTHIFSYIDQQLNFLRQNVVYLDEKSKLKFENEIYEYIYNKIYLQGINYVDNPRYNEVYGYTENEIKWFIERLCDIYISCIMEPGSAVGAIVATSLGEPATQMTLKTFHFAGVASMNITQGVPRIQEIINATSKIKTPIMTCQLEINDDEQFAKMIKARINVTYLGEICESMENVMRPSKSYIECQLNLVKIGRLNLEITNREIAIIIHNNIKKMLPKINGYKYKDSDIDIFIYNDNVIRIQPYGDKICVSTYGIIFDYLMKNLANVPIKGMQKVCRVMIHQKRKQILPQHIYNLREKNIRLGASGSKLLLKMKHDMGEYELEKICHVLKIDKINKLLDVEIVSTKDILRNIAISNNLSQYQYQLYVEGAGCFLDILGVVGINGEMTVSNNIMEVAQVLGIEAGYLTIIHELQGVYYGHGLKIDKRHSMLVADIMSYTGKVMGFTRYGMMGKQNKPILTMASFEETCKHLYQAAFHGETDRICGVSDSIIVGVPIPIGTGAFDVLQDDFALGDTPLILGECSLEGIDEPVYREKKEERKEDD